MIVLGIDPGSEQSAAVVLEGAVVHKAVFLPNDEMRQWLMVAPAVDIAAIEQIGHYGSGMPAGKSVFDTCRWIGRFEEHVRRPVELILRATIKAHLCGSAKGTDANVRRALLDLDRWPRTGGGKEPTVGVKAQPGPLFGITSHKLSALAVAVTCADQHSARERT